ncbi:MAG: ATP-binding cassette domain-containing protein [Deltaproteobacteria bacterium]
MGYRAVDVEDLVKKFGDFTAVGGISFSVGRGEIFGFLGPNGAGKSTTIKILCGIVPPTSGTGHVGGFDVVTGQAGIKQNIGYMSQRFSLYEDLTVEENIDFYSGIYRIPKEKREESKARVIRMAGLEEFRSRITGTLPVGWKQRLALGCAIIHDPAIVFLDEPTSGVDPLSRERFWGIIKDLTRTGVTVFVTTHYMGEAENCDRLALIYRGAIIAQGTPHQLKTEAMKEDVLRIEVARSQEYLDTLKEVPGVEETALFGVNLHAVVDDAGRTAPGIRRFFEREGVSVYSIEQIEPSLEDVFVSLIETYDRENPR